MLIKIKGQIPHVGAGVAFSGPWYLAFPVKQVSVCINGSNFNWRFAPTRKRIKALLISALRRQSRYTHFKAPFSKTGKDNFTFYSLFPKDTPKLTSGTLLLLGQRYHFYLTWRGVAHITKIDGKSITSCMLTQQSRVKKFLGKKCSLPARMQLSQRLTLSRGFLLSLHSVCSFKFKAWLVWECILKALFSTGIKNRSQKNSYNSQCAIMPPS